MPRYSYYCESCEQTSEVFHLINETQEQCLLCLAKGTLTKLVSRPIINTLDKASDATVKERVEGHIEEARQELLDQRSELVNEDMINDN